MQSKTKLQEGTSKDPEFSRDGWVREANPLFYSSPLLSKDDSELLASPLDPLAFQDGYLRGHIAWDNRQDYQPARRPHGIEIGVVDSEAWGYYAGWSARHIGDLRGWRSAYNLATLDITGGTPELLAAPLDLAEFTLGYEVGKQDGRPFNCGRVAPSSAFFMGFVKGRLDTYRHRSFRGRIAFAYNEVVTQMAWEGVTAYGWVMAAKNSLFESETTESLYYRSALPIAVINEEVMDNGEVIYELLDGRILSGSELKSVSSSLEDAYDPFVKDLDKVA